MTSRRGGYDGRREKEMARTEEIEMEIRNQAIKKYPECVALFELPNMVYAQIMKDNDTRKKPYRISYERIKGIIQAMDF